MALILINLIKPPVLASVTAKNVCVRYKKAVIVHTYHGLPSTSAGLEFYTFLQKRFSVWGPLSSSCFFVVSFVNLLQ